MHLLAGRALVLGVEHSYVRADVGVWPQIEQMSSVDCLLPLVVLLVLRARVLAAVVARRMRVRVSAPPARRRLVELDCVKAHRVCLLSRLPELQLKLSKRKRLSGREHCLVLQCLERG